MSILSVQSTVLGSAEVRDITASCERGVGRGLEMIRPSWVLMAQMERLKHREISAQRHTGNREAELRLEIRPSKIDWRF